MSDDKPPKWSIVDAPAARALEAITNSPGASVEFGTNHLPDRLSGMPGVCSYMASAYPSVVPTTYGVTAGGELLVARIDGATTKHYQYNYGTSSNGQVVFCGDYKNFSLHHVTGGQQFATSDLFGHTPFSNKHGL
jgi:hypothetical protein